MSGQSKTAINIALFNTQDAMPTLGLGYLVSYYQKYGRHKEEVNFKIIEGARRYDCQFAEPIASIVAKINEADLLGITSITQDFDIILELVKEVKKKLRIPIIIGGHHISALPKSLPLEADVGVIGEGEQTFLELVDLFVEQKKFTTNNLKGILGICHHNGKRSKVFITQKRPHIKNLDIIPPPAYNLFSKHHWMPKIGNYKIKGKILGSISTSRGCPYNCIFCSSSRQWENKIRFFSAEHVVEEIKELHEKYGCDLVNINDDLAIISVNRLEKIACLLEKTGLIKKIEVYSIQARANLLNQRICNVLKRLKVKKIALGIESGSDKTLKYLKGKNASAKKNWESINLALKNGFEVWPQLIVGAPNETKEEVLKTLEFTKIPQIKNYQICLLVPLPGTPLWDYAKKKGLVNDKMDWSKLSLEVNEKNFCNKVYLEKNISREELWKIIKEPVKQVQLDQLRNINLKLAKSWKTYLYLTLNQPYKYLPLITDIILAKIKWQLRRIKLV